MTDGRTHWEGCHEHHLDCALARLAEADNLLEECLRTLRARAEPVGPLHAYWDTIFEIEAHLKRASDSA